MTGEGRYIGKTGNGPSGRNRLGGFRRFGPLLFNSRWKRDDLLATLGGAFGPAFGALGLTLSRRLAL